MSKVLLFATVVSILLPASTISQPVVKFYDLWQEVHGQISPWFRKNAYNEYPERILCNFWPDSAFDCSTNGYDGACQPGNVQCNGQVECESGRDEKGCKDDPYLPCCQNCFKCPVSKKCIFASEVCDGNFDCDLEISPGSGITVVTDKSDELGCYTRPCSSDRYKCSDLCLETYKGCPVNGGCPDGSKPQTWFAQYDKTLQRTLMIAADAAAENLNRRVMSIHFSTEVNRVKQIPPLDLLTIIQPLMPDDTLSPDFFEDFYNCLEINNSSQATSLFNKFTSKSFYLLDHRHMRRCPDNKASIYLEDLCPQNARSQSTACSGHFLFNRADTAVSTDRLNCPFQSLLYQPAPSPDQLWPDTYSRYGDKYYPGWQICDARYDDRSIFAADEANCAEKRCCDSCFKCLTSNKCILASSVCDTFNDCGLQRAGQNPIFDQSDESNCVGPSPRPCASDKFYCKSTSRCASVFDGCAEANELEDGSYNFYCPNSDGPLHTGYFNLQTVESFARSIVSVELIKAEFINRYYAHRFGKTIDEFSEIFQTRSSDIVTLAMTNTYDERVEVLSDLEQKGAPYRKFYEMTRLIQEQDELSDFEAQFFSMYNVLLCLAPRKYIDGNKFFNESLTLEIVRSLSWSEAMCPRRSMRRCPDGRCVEVDVLCPTDDHLSYACSNDTSIAYGLLHDMNCPNFVNKNFVPSIYTKVTPPDTTVVASTTTTEQYGIAMSIWKAITKTLDFYLDNILALLALGLGLLNLAFVISAVVEYVRRRPRQV